MSAAETWHERHRERLEALSGGDAVIEGVAEAGRGRPAWSSDRTWRRTFGRIELDREQYATLVLESGEDPQTIVLVEAFERRPRGQAAEGTTVRAKDVGWLRIVPFVEDPDLSTLRAVAAEQGAVAVRYRPYRRCTLRVESGGVVRFAKVFPDGRGDTVHAVGLAMWGAAGRGELGFAVPRPAAYSPSIRTVWHEELVGEPVRPHLYGAGGEEVARRIGAAAATLTRSRLVPPATYAARAQLDDSGRKVSELIRLVPRLADPARELLRGLQALHDDVKERPLRPIHGAPHANQWLISRDRLGLVDFDRVALGDPERDAATFAAELDFEDRTRVPVEDLNRAFLDGYDDVAGGFEPTLLQAYRAHKRLAKALRTARALRPDGDERAERHLARAAECVWTEAGVA